MVGDGATDIGRVVKCGVTVTNCGGFVGSFVTVQAQ